LYHAVIRFIDKHLLVRTGSGLAAVVLAACGLALFIHDSRLPISALIVYGFIAFAYVVSSRLLVRSFLREVPQSEKRDRKLVGIFGAGEAGAQLALAMRSETKFRPVCFFDDKRELEKQNVAGLKVFQSEYLIEVVRRLGISMIVLAIPSAPPKRRRQVIHAMSRAGVEVKTLNSLIELKDAGITSESIREVKIEDLLGRNPVPPRQDLFARCVQGKSVLVTGAGGSIGSELCRQISTLAPRQLHLLEHSEFALYSIDQELRARFPKLTIHAHLGSVCEVDAVERIMQDGRIDTVYHAAAYKHVPIVEANMAEGIRNNVLGAQVVAEAAARFGVRTCVLISTDKAVRPTNVMGATKRIGELIFQSAAEVSGGRTTFCMVRLGNVLASSGSVIPVFQRQIAQGGPVTITHPEIIRYFMLIPEAAQLVMQAGAMAQGGDVFVLDMGEPVKIVDLARTMIEMSGLVVKDEERPDGDIEIRFIGLRPGEKLYEELLIGDNTFPTDHPRIMGANETSIHHTLLVRMIDRLMRACTLNDPEMIRATLKSIVPEYVPQGEDAARLPRPVAARSYLYRKLAMRNRIRAGALVTQRRRALANASAERRERRRHYAAAGH
ncbi:MAG TPA: nucleoside-diphosphate sugar epimerase/dehydratase, partial [Noviherbaspirillum sp.]